MKKYLNIAFILFAGLAFTVACSKENLAEPQVDPETETEITPEENEGEKVTITVTLPEEMTKVSLTQDASDADGAVNIAWDTDDAIYVIDAANASNYAKFDIDASSINGITASFTGTAPSGASSYNILYSKDSNIKSVTDAEAVSFTSQTQDGNASTSGLNYMALVSGVSTYENVELGETWATNNGGNFKQSGIFRARIKLPTAITSVSAITFVASDDVFYTTNACSATTNSFKVSFSSNATPESQILTVYAMLPWANVAVAAETTLGLIIETADKTYARSGIQFGGTSGVNLEMGKANWIRLNCANTAGALSSVDGAGTSTSPYIITTTEEMMAMPKYLVPGETKYFELGADIDLSGETWVPFNTEEPYDKYINFNGNNHTVSNLSTDATTPPSYPSLFGVLNGTVKDLTIDNATITPGQKKAGVLAGYIGSGSTTASSVSGITITNSTVGTSTTPGTYGCGILAAQSNVSGNTISDISITNSSVYCNNTGTGSSVAYTGGLLGQVSKRAAISNITMTDCTVDGGPQYTGGAISVIQGEDGTTISNVAVSSTNVTGTLAGGVVGYANAATTISGSSYAGGTVKGTSKYIGGFIGSTGAHSTTISDCNVENATVDATSAGDDCRTGGFAGQLAKGVTVKGCSVGTSSQKVSITLGSLTASGKVFNSGGFAGVNYGTITKNDDGTKCSAYADITSKCTETWRFNVGGFVGFNTGAIQYSDSNVDMSTLTGQYIGGLVGFATDNNDGTSSISNCSATGNINGYQYVGGLVGVLTIAENKTATIEKSCYKSGTATASYRYGSGLVGYKNGAGTMNITNCYVAGNAVAANGWSGGILACHKTGVSNLANCYVTGSVTAMWGAGGIVGQVAAADLSVVRCMPFNSSIRATNTDSSAHYSSGAVIAYGKSVNVIVDYCYRVSDMASRFNDCTSNAANVIEQHAFITTAATIPQRKSLTYGYYHHGMDTNFSLINLVSKGVIGEDWSTDIWDLSGDTPTLK